MRRLMLDAGARIVAIQTLAVAVFALVIASAASVAQEAASTPRSVWSGVFTGEQADRGRILYAANCAECHGGDLEGREGAPLRGDRFWADWGERDVGELLAYVTKNMPFSEDGSLAGTLPASTYADIVAHILQMNEFPAGARELVPGAGAGVRITKKDGPGELPASTLAHVVGCLAPRGADGSWRLVRATRPERVTQGAPNRSAPLGDREYALKFVLRSLNNFVGHRMSVTGLLLGDGGIDGLNVSTADSVAATCE